MNKYSRLFKMVRMELRFTQKDLADKLDINVGSVYKYENEKMMPGARVLEKVYQLCKSKNLSEPMYLFDNVVQATKNKGDSEMDYKYLSDLQKEKINQQRDEIARLTQIVENYNKDSKPAFHFKTKADWDMKNNIFTNRSLRGDTSMTGYTKDELVKLSPEEWLAMFHPDSMELIISNMNQALTDTPEFQHTIWKHVYWKAKDGTYRMYNVEAYWSGEEGVVRTYYYWVNGDIEAKS